MSGYAFHPDAFADLDEIWEYIAQDNVDAAGFSPTSIRPPRFIEAVPSASLYPSAFHRMTCR